MTKEEVKIGDIVFLKSGSPMLTVTAIDENGLVGVSYYNSEDGIIHRSFYPPDSLYPLS